MPTITRIEDLEIWQMARVFARSIGEITATDLFKQEEGLRKQIRNASGSVMDNIAEGFGRTSRNEFVHHLTIARGSLQETRSQIYRCRDLNLVNPEICNELLASSEILSRRISSLIIYLQKTSIKGQKFRHMCRHDTSGYVDKIITIV